MTDSTTDPSADESVKPTRQEIMSAAATVASALVPPSKEFELSNGIVLKLRSVPPLAIRQAVLAVPRPKPPILKNPDTDEEYENTIDPDYIKAAMEHYETQFLVTGDVLVLMGTKIQSYPDDPDVIHLEDDEWIAMLRDGLNLKVDDSNAYRKYLSYMRLYALTSESETTELLQRITMLSGVSEVEVQRAAAAFRRAEERGADTAGPAEDDTDGD